MVLFDLVDGVLRDLDHQVLVADDRLTAQPGFRFQPPCLVEQIIFLFARFVQRIEAFTYDHFRGLFDGAEAKPKKSIKEFIISRPGVTGVGNGYIQDVLFRAGILPTRKVVDIAPRERRKLYHAIRKTISEAIRLGGRDDESDLFGQGGRYRRILDSRAKGKPCAVCGTTVEKIAFLGGASYFCPTCQT